MSDGPTFQLLAIVVLPIVVGLVWMFVAAVFRSPGIVPHSTPVARTGTIFRLFSIADAFDPERAILWEAQIPALQRIGSGIPISRYFAICGGPLRLYPELFEDITLTGWLEFLRNSGLIEIVGSEVRLTTEGRAFLTVLNRRYSVSRGPVKYERRGP